MTVIVLNNSEKAALASKHDTGEAFAFHSGHCGRLDRAPAVRQCENMTNEPKAVINVVKNSKAAPTDLPNNQPHENRGRKRAAQGNHRQVAPTRLGATST